MEMPAWERRGCKGSSQVRTPNFQHVRVSGSMSHLESKVVFIRNMAQNAWEGRFATAKGISVRVMDKGSHQSC